MSYVLSAFADEADQSFTEQMRVCGGHSINQIEIRGVNGKNISDMTIAEVKSLKEQMDANGFAVSSIGSPYGKISVNDDFRPHLEKYKSSVEAAHILGTKYMRMFSFYIPDGEAAEAYEGIVTERLGQFLEQAGELTLCHENEKGIYGDIPERCKKLYDAFGGKLKLVFDPANFIQCGAGIEHAYLLLHDAIEYFHIKDCIAESGRVVPAGSGDGKIEWLINTFAEKGKTAFLSLEPHLKVFSGFAELENGGSLDSFTYETNEKAFSAAVMALKSLLCANGFTQVKDTGKSCGIWTK